MAGLKKGLRLAVLAAVALAAGELVHFLFFTQTGGKLLHSNMLQLSETLRSFGFFSYIFAVLAVFAATFFPIMPFFIIAGATVIAFGFAEGFAISYSSSVASACTAFLVSRYAAHDWVAGRIGKHRGIGLFNRRLQQNGFAVIALARVIPIIPSSLINFGSGLSTIRFGAFFWATVVGKLPMVYIECLIGHDLLHFRRYKYRLLFLLLLFAALVGFGIYLQRRLAQKNPVTNPSEEVQNERS